MIMLGLDLGYKIEVEAAFKNDLESIKDTEILEHWDLCVKLSGKHLHSGAGLINCLMTVVEKVFKLADGVGIEAAFRSWIVLMNNFSLSPHILNSSKQGGQLTRPLQVSNTNVSMLWSKFSLPVLSVQAYLSLFYQVLLPFQLSRQTWWWSTLTRSTTP